jgi:hypothetical protein
MRHTDRYGDDEKRHAMRHAHITNCLESVT